MFSSFQSYEKDLSFLKLYLNYKSYPSPQRDYFPLIPINGFLGLYYFDSDYFLLPNFSLIFDFEVRFNFFSKI